MNYKNRDESWYHKQGLFPLRHVYLLLWVREKIFLVEKSAVSLSSPLPLQIHCSSDVQSHL